MLRSVGFVGYGCRRQKYRRYWASSDEPRRPRLSGQERRRCRLTGMAKRGRKPIDELLNALVWMAKLRRPARWPPARRRP